jgi:hypothetical protein
MGNPISWFQSQFPRRVVDSVPGFGTAAAIGRAMREGIPVDIEGQPLFFRDLPDEAGQKKITLDHGHPQGRVFTAQEVEAVGQAAAVNRELNDATLRSMQGLYDDHDPRVLAGMALVGALGGGGLALLSRPSGPPQQVIEQGAA